MALEETLADPVGLRCFEPMPMDDLQAYRAWLILQLLPDVGRLGIVRLVRRLGSPDAVLEATERELMEVEGIGAMAARSIRDWRELVDVEAEMALIDECGVSLTAFTDEDYPVNLGCMRVPPPLLYYRGSLSPMDEAAVAMIGSRKMSRYGREATQLLAKDLARAGVTIVSGLALGVDSQAHRCALDAGGRTLAVLGNGLASVYPAQHRQLAEEVAENGALFSEMPMAASPDTGSFPQRNAIIAGLSLGVVVVEAAAKSGTQITAGYALEENRSVFAVPGDITRANSMGTNELIKDGAKLVTRAQDILLDLRAELGRVLDNLPDLAQAADDEIPALPKDLSPTEALVHEKLALDPLSIDALDAELADDGVSLSALMSALLSLELRGLIKQEPGKRFRRTL